jgi:FAD/FMN-containing dehydrogenase
VNAGGAPITSSVLEELSRIAGQDSVLARPQDRKAFSYDAGIYRVDPQAVVLPRSAETAEAVLRFASENGIPLTFRSGGTNLGGGAIGPGIVMGMSRLKEMDFSGIEDGYVEVGPGVILKELNDRLMERGRFFAPDPSSGLACQIGGMIGTNAAGAHSLKYGAVKDNILAMDFVPLEGDRTRLLPVLLDGSPKSHRIREELPPAFTRLLAILPEWAPVLRKARKNVSKNSSGYNLFDLVERLFPEIPSVPSVFDPLRLVIGAEGTLGLVTRARLLVRPLPQRKSTILAFFHDL